MFFTKAGFVTAAALFAQGQAAAIASVPAGLNIIQSVTVDNATLTWYGNAGPATRSTQEARGAQDVGCGSNRIQCATSHAYDGPLCLKLFSTLTNVDMPVEPRSVCLGQGTDQCCISWSKTTIFSMEQKDVLPSAKRVYSECGPYYSKSGQEWNVLLDGTCVSQCLSNRPDGCK